MFKIQILFLFLLFFTPLIWAQSASNFDGVDDKATVYHHSDFNLSTNDFTIEAIVRDVALDQAMLTIISKRDLSTNGFALMLNTHDGIKLIAEIGKDKYEIKTSAFEDKGCHSIGVRRLKGDITLFIDDKAYSFGKNTRDVNTTENLIIGDDGSNTHNPFDGYIEEVRFWNIARSDNQVFNWNHKCIAPSTSGLLALWSIEENSGQFFHDVASVKHHAYLGSGFSNDNQDPLWTSNECLEDCCNAAVGFTVSEPSPKAYQYVNFTNTSTNGSNYQWYVNDVLESTTTDFKFAFPIGTHIIRLLTTGDKCTSMKSWVFEVTDFLDNCGEPININPCLPDPYEANQNQMRILDRFGNCYSPEELALPPPTASRSNVAGYPAGQVCNCGIFTLYFQDVISNTDVGFDNPNSPQGTGFSTLGEERRAVVCRVFEDLSLLVGANPTASNLGVEDLRIHVGASDGTGLLDMPPGAVASGSSYFFELTSPTVHKFASGEVARTIISGRDSYQDWLLYNPAVTSDPHGIVQFNFANVSFSSNLASFTGNHIYIVGLHEAIHALGFASLIGSSTGPSRFTSSNAPNIYSYWDQFLESNQLPVINSTVTANNLALSFTPNTVNSCGSPSTLNGISFDGISAAGSHPVYYNGSYQLGSTFSHYNCTAGVSGYVMNYSGISSVTPNPLEVETLCKLGYTISGTFGQNLTSVNQSNTLANYTACTPSTCIPIGFVDVEDPNNLGNPYTVDRTGTNNQVSINFLDLLLNDVVPVGTTVEDLQILRGGGTLSATSSVGNTLFTYNPNLGFSGWASLSYVPRCSNGELGEVVYVYIWVPAAAAPACNLPTSACNLVCNGDFEAFAPNIFQGNHSQLENYWFSYGNIRALNRSCDLHGYTISNPPGSHPFLCGQIPLPIDFPQKNNYVGIVLNTNTSESFNLELQPGTTLIPSTTDNYRIGFWAWTCQAQDFDVRVAFAPAPPCPSAPFLLSDLEDASGYQPSWMNPLYTGPICTNFGLAADKFNLQVPVSNPNTVGNGSWFYVTHDFHTTVPNLRELIVHLDQVNVNNNLYVLLDNFTIEDLNIPKINISSTIIGSTCRGANPTIRYTIEGDASIPVGSPLTNVQLNITLPTNIPANLSWAAGGDFTSGQYTIPTLAQGDVIVLDLPLNILPNAFIGSSNQVLIEPTIAGACVSAFSNQSTNVIVTNSASQLAISTTILGSTSSSAQYQVEVTNNGSEGIYNIELEVPPVNGLTFSFNPALFDLLPGATQTFTLNSTFSITSGCPVLCAEINSASFACNLPVSGCAPAVTVGTGGNALDFPMQMNAIPTGMTTGSDGSIYATGLFYQNLNFVEGTNINTLNYTGTGGVNVFVVKYDNCGFAWAQEIPINTNTLGLQASPDIEVDGSGNVFTSFIFDNPFLSYTSNGAQDIAIAKFNTTGTLQWIKTDGGLENDLVVDLELYETGSQTHIIIAGYTKGTGTIGTTNTNNATIASTTIPYFNEISSSNFKYLYGVSFIASYLDGSTNPTDQWAEFIDGPTSTSVPTYANNFVPTIPSKIAIDPSGNIYFSGIAYEDFTFPNKSNNATIYPNGFYGTTPSLDLDLFTTSYSLSGTENWCVFYGDDIYGAFGGGEGSRMGIDLEVDNSNNLYLVAPYSYYLNSHETHLVKINTVTGTIAGFTPLTNGNGVIMHSNLAVDNSGNPIVSSNFLLTSSPNNQNIDFYSALPGGQNVSITSGDMIGWAVEKFNSSLGFEWVLANTTITPTSPSDLYLTAPPFDIDIAPNGDIYNCIFVNGDIALNGGTYGPTLTNSDGYIIRIQDQGTGGVYARQATNNNTAQNQNTVSTLSNNTIENTTSNISTKLYPNPTTGKVTLEIKSDKENNKVEQIIIYDVTGRKVQEISTKEQQKLYDINLNSQQSGVYFVEMMINQELITKRVILMK